MEFPDWHFDNHGNEIFLIWKKRLKEKGTIVTQEHLREFERAYRVLTIAAEQAHPAQQFLKRWFIETTLWKQFMDDPELEKFPWTAPKSMTPKEAAEASAKNTESGTSAAGIASKPKGTATDSKDAKAAGKSTKPGNPAVSTTLKPNNTAVKQKSASAEIKVTAKLKI
ncbi:hypothetical protein DL95DRAFT_467939 [Leptodontidium sp. 2 PMI_412]|nr:hypothetical protein DL95DRAFT_467939 [Leptodontidium sp. 2 PMI_412]